MTQTLAGGCYVSELRDGVPFTEGTVRIWNQIGRSTGAHAISLRVLEFAPGLSPGIRNHECDEVLYVISGEKSAELLIDGSQFKIGVDSGIYVRPAETWAIENPGPSSLLIVSSRCPDPDRSPEFTSPPDASKPSSEARVVRLSDRPSLPTADRWYRVLVDDEVGSTQVTQFVGSIPPGRAPDHFHQYEEVLVILKGEGRMWAGKTNTPISVGSCIYLPKGQVHCVENTGKGELRLLGVFYPAGSPSVRYET